MTREMTHRIWAEQDDTTSRVMIQVGGDKPLCLIEYDRTLVDACESTALLNLQPGGDVDAYRGRAMTMIKVDVVLPMEGGDADIRS